MDSKQYISDVSKTVSGDMPKIRERLERTYPLLFEYLYNLMASSGDLDELKKYIFYGKESLLIQNQLACHATARPTTLECDRAANQFSDSEINVLHGIIGVATEAGEMIEMFINFMEGQQLDRVNLCEEQGDSFWYHGLLAKENNTTFEDIFEKNIAKLKKRYGEKFSNDKAINRDLVIEREILEGVKDI